MQTFALIDYDSGNIRSVERALHKGCKEAGIDAEILKTDKPDDILQADRIILPGVGAFADCLAGLEKKSGIRAALQQRVMSDGVPFLGICVGMQLLADFGHEYGRHEGLGWIGGEVKALKPSSKAFRIPHMGWNEVKQTGPHSVFENIKDGAHFYFVHSFAFQPKDPLHELAQCDHGGAFTAAILRDNILGTQFHPEKSQQAGLQFICNFLKWTP